MTELTTAIEQREKTAQFIWTGIILLFFLMQAVIWMVALTLTSSDKSNAVVAGYDEKALNWDEEMAVQNASSRLGWKAELFVDPTADIDRSHAITLKLSNADQAVIKNATIELSAFHRARSGDPQQIEFTEINEGVYAGRIQIRKSGFWQFDGAARKGGDTFLINQTQVLKTSK